MTGELIVLIWLAAAVSLLVLIQLVVLGAVLAMVFKVRNKARQIEKSLQASGVDLSAMAGAFHRLLQTLVAAIEESLAAAHSLRQWGAGVHARLERFRHAFRVALGMLKRSTFS